MNRNLIFIVVLHLQYDDLKRHVSAQVFSLDVRRESGSRKLSDLTGRWRLRLCTTGNLNTSRGRSIRCVFREKFALGEPKDRFVSNASVRQGAQAWKGWMA